MVYHAKFKIGDRVVVRDTNRQPYCVTSIQADGTPNRPMIIKYGLRRAEYPLDSSVFRAGDRIVDESLLEPEFDDNINTYKFLAETFMTRNEVRITTGITPGRNPKFQIDDHVISDLGRRYRITAIHRRDISGGWRYDLDDFYGGIISSKRENELTLTEKTRKVECTVTMEIPANAPWESRHFEMHRADIQGVVSARWPGNWNPVVGPVTEKK